MFTSYLCFKSGYAHFLNFFGCNATASADEQIVHIEFELIYESLNTS